jgi:hypothetical protein
MKMMVYSGWLMVVIGVVTGVGGIAVGQPLFGVPMLLGMGGGGAFMVWIGRGWDTTLDDAADLYKYGRPANATVLSVADEQLKPDGTRLAKLTLHVTPVNESDYKTTRVLALPKARVPMTGERLTVKFDPQSRKNVVLLDETYEVEDSLTVAARQMRATFT